MEAFSAAGTAITLIELCVKAVQCVRNAQKSAFAARTELDALVDEIIALQNVGSLVIKLKDDLTTTLPDANPNETQLVKDFNAGVINTIKECQSFLQQVQKLAQEIFIFSDAEISKVEAMKTAMRRHRRKGDIEELRLKIQAGQNRLQMFLTAINIMQERATAGSVRGVSEVVRKLGFDLNRLMVRVKTEGTPNTGDVPMYGYLSPMTGLLRSIKLNKHFDVPRCIDSSFIGRGKLLSRLKEAFDQPCSTESPSPKVFVIYGFPGSGKTDFSYKFAEQYRESFWGIFVLQADSEDLLVNSFRRIVQYADKKTEPNVAIAKHWLADQTMPWLLILDNADDPDLDIRRYLPASPFGCVLITTRNQDLKIHGNVGQRSFNFERLSRNDAKAVLLTAAAEPNPVRLYADVAAGTISDELQCLPLALVTAGRTIRSNLASWKTYLGWYRRSCDEISKQLGAGNVLKEVEKAKYTVIPALEPHLRQLETQKDRTSIDALELIHTLAYFHHRNISLRLLKLVAKNANNVADATEHQKDENFLPLSVKDKLMNSVMRMISAPPVLPSVLKNLTVDLLDEDRLRAALSKLEKLNLIRRDSADSNDDNDYTEPTILESTKNKRNEGGYDDDSSSSDVDDIEQSYSLHPLVHSWVRQRHSRTGDRAVWCAAAITAISQCIVLEREAFIGKASSFFDARELLPHLNQAQKYKSEIDRELMTNDMKSGWMRKWLRLLRLIPTGPSLLTLRNDALTSIKFSLVYSLCGDFHQAAELQSRVRLFVIAARGMKSTISILITLALASTMQKLTRFPEACELQAEVLSACRELYGDKHPQTLTMMDQYGLLLRFEGRLSDSLHLQQEAHDGFVKLGPKFLRQVYVTKAHMASVHSGFLQFELARNLCADAINGLEVLDPNDEEISFAQETLSILCGELGEADTAHHLAVEIHRKRTDSLGEQHPLTLWAAAVRSRSLWRLGLYDQALEMLEKPLTVAAMTFGQDNFAYLSAVTLRACILTGLGRYTEAEKLFLFLDGQYEKLRIERNRDHSDRIIALGYHIDLCQARGRYTDALHASRRMLDTLRNLIKGRSWSHPLRPRIQQKIIDLEGLVLKQQADGRSDSNEPLPWTPVMDFRDLVAGASK